MTKNEKDLFDSMVKKITFDIRRKFSNLSAESGVSYVMVPLADVLSEIRTFTSSIEVKSKNETHKD